MERTMSVTGKGAVSVKADLVQFHLHLNDTRLDYGEAIRESDRATDQLKSALVPLGFERTDLKTLSFSVDSKYEGYQDERGQYKQRFAGFEYDHQLVLETEADKDLVGRVLTALLKSGVETSFKLVYTVKDQEAAQRQVLGRAVRDAKDKAEVLAREAGIQLGKLIHISYGSRDLLSKAEVMRGARMGDPALMAAVNPDIEAQDIRLEDTVRLVWEIT